MPANYASEATATTHTGALALPPLDQDQNQSFPFFPHLPTEIRQLIWLFTFSPRIVQIQLHSHVLPRDPTRWAVIHFTASEDLCAIPPCSAKARRLSSLGTRSDALQTSSKHGPPHGMSRRYPRGPTALYVCRESREVALRHYELAFGGVEEYEDILYSQAWLEGGFAEKKIWVNFKMDLITILTHEHVVLAYLPVARKNAIYELTQHAKTETRKIQRLAVSECWDPAGHHALVQNGEFNYSFVPCAGNGIVNGAGAGYFDDMSYHRDSVTSSLRKLLKHFKSIKELEVYEIGGHKALTSPDHVQTMRSEFYDEDLGPWREELLRSLEHEKEITPEWTADLPKITVRKGWRLNQKPWDGSFLP